jgi:hypothetical protein
MAREAPKDCRLGDGAAASTGAAAQIAASPAAKTAACLKLPITNP